MIADKASRMDTPTPYRVSTITCNGHVGTGVDLRLFHENLALTTVEDVAATGTPGFVYTETSPTDTRGVYPKRRRGGDERPRRLFDNQVTVIFYFRAGYAPNVKLFRNGNIHMTGVRDLPDGRYITERMAHEVRRMALGGVPAADADAVMPRDFTVRMINCDFAMPFLVRRKDLHHMLIAPPFNIMSSFQPNTYPGVKVQYYYNAAHAAKTGQCKCAVPCDCKKVTIAVFESGKILVTGATDYDQVDEAYAYICRVLMENAARLKKTLPAI